MALRKVKGRNFRIFQGSATFIEETSCNVTIQGNMEDSSTKDTVGAWKTESMVEKQWNVQVEQKDATLSQLRSIIGLFVADSLVNIGWDETAADAPHTAQNADFARAGYAYLNDLSINANDREDVVISSQWQGSGALA